MIVCRTVGKLIEELQKTDPESDFIVRIITDAGYANTGCEWLVVEIDNSRDNDGSRVILHGNDDGDYIR